MNASRVAVVTGAGTGIGKAAALALLKEGYGVAFAGRRLQPLEHAIAEAGSGALAIAVATDVGDPASVKTLFAKVKTTFGGRLDVLFNNASTGAPSIPLENLTYEQWTAVLNAKLIRA